MTDFKPYSPSYNAPASFMSTPVYIEGQPIGTLVIQLPVKLFTDIMSSNESWAEVGMGRTGDVFLVGPDKTLRTNSRASLENPREFANTLVKAQLLSSEEAANLINRQTSVGIVKVTTAAIDNALAGQTSLSEANSYLGERSLISASPITIGGMQLELAAVATIRYFTRPFPPKARGHPLLLRMHFTIVTWPLPIAKKSATPYRNQFLSKCLCG